MKQFSYTHNDGTYTLHMGGEGKFNDVSLTDANEMIDIIDTDGAAKALVITGEGKIFAQGLDLGYLSTLAPEAAIAFVENCMHFVGRMMTLGIPVTAAINGHAFGLGAMLVLASDYKVMRNDRGYFCLPEVDLNMTLAPAMNTLVCETLNARALRDLLFTGKRATADDCLGYGVVDLVVPLDALMAAAVEISQPMVGKPQDVLSALKRDAREPIISAIKAQGG